MKAACIVVVQFVAAVAGYVGCAVAGHIDAVVGLEM